MSTEKFQRNYSLFVETSEIDKNNDLIFANIKYPLDIEFETNKTINTGGFNSANIRIYNLDENLQKAIYQDYSNYMSKKLGKGRSIILYAGYCSELHIIFKGIIREAYSFNENTNTITLLDCVSSSVFLNHTFLNTTFNKETTLDYIISHIINQMPNVQRGYLGKEQTTIFNRSITISSSTDKFLNDYEINYFIDDEVVNVIGVNEFLPIPILKIGNSTGLLKTPQRRQNILTVNSIFEPNIKLGQLVEIDAAIIKQYNGIYKCSNIKHQGGIGGTIQTNLTTTIELLYDKKYDFSTS